VSVINGYPNEKLVADFRIGVQLGAARVSPRDTSVTVPEQQEGWPMRQRQHDSTTLTFDLDIALTILPSITITITITITLTLTLTFTLAHLFWGRHGVLRYKTAVRGSAERQSAVIGVPRAGDQSVQ
jgi:hypothetical protein